MNENESLLPPFVPTRRSVRVLGGLFMVSAAISWIAVGYDVSELNLMLTKSASGERISHEVLLRHQRAGEIVGLAQLVILVVTGFSFLTWLHRVRVNVRALGVRRLVYRREWTILGFFVPILNALRPYQVVREIWQASDPVTGDPMAWKTVHTPPLIAVWWGLFVAYFVLEASSMAVLGFATTLGGVRFAYTAGFLADLSAALSASFAYFVVVRISEAQEAKRSAYGRGELSTVPFDPRDAIA